MTTLYDLMGRFAEIQDAVYAEEDPERIERLMTMMDEDAGELSDKVDKICRLLRNVESDMEQQEFEEKRLAKRRKALGNAKNRLRDWVRSSMDLLDVRQIKTPVHTITITEGRPSVILLDINQVPPEYKRVTVALDKAAVMKIYKSDGEIVAGCDVEPGPPILTVR